VSDDGYEILRRAAAAASDRVADDIVAARGADELQRAHGVASVARGLQRAIDSAVAELHAAGFSGVEAEAVVVILARRLYPSDYL